jgi:hypothetical protein
MVSELPLLEIFQTVLLNTLGRYLFSIQRPATVDLYA